MKIAELPTQCEGMDVRLPVHKGEPGQPCVVIVNSATAMMLVCDKDGHISTEMMPLVDAISEIERFIAQLRSSGAIEASAALKAARQASNVVGLVRESPKAV